jgi:hypothetical protein
MTEEEVKRGSFRDQRANKIEDDDVSSHKTEQSSDKKQKPSNMQNTSVTPRSDS